jgi:hypothetical protein
MPSVSVGFSTESPLPTRPGVLSSAPSAAKNEETAAEVEDLRAQVRAQDSSPHPGTAFTDKFTELRRRHEDVQNDLRNRLAAAQADALDNLTSLEQAKSEKGERASDREPSFLGHAQGPGAEAG